MKQLMKQLISKGYNERTIQVILVPALLDLQAIIGNSDTDIVVEGEFLPECVSSLLQQTEVSPLLQQAKETPISPPWPDVTIGLQDLDLSMGYTVTLYELGLIARPIDDRTAEMAFPCFTLDFKDDSDIYHAEVPNRYSTAMILYYLRLVSCKAHGEKETQKSFDNFIRCFSATVSRSTVAISTHWTTQELDGLHFYSSVIKSFTMEDIAHAEWNEIARWLRNAVDFNVGQTLAQVRTDLELTQHARRSAIASPASALTTPGVRRSPRRKK